MKFPIAIWRRFGLVAVSVFSLVASNVIADEPAKEDGPGHVVYLLTQESLRKDKIAPPLARELFRQGLLIAARDNMGLQTRDQSLREWAVDFAPEHPLSMVTTDQEVSIVHGGPEGDVVWDQNMPESPWWPGQTTKYTEIIEGYSNVEFVKILQDLGYKGEANKFQEDAPPPADAEARLADLDELTQFGLIRETHELIRTSGESPARLGVLIRAYANLGQLTRYHWSVEHQVYEARSLLYAARLMAKKPNTPFAYWHRAYARAMAGFLGDAQKDMADAPTKGADKPPAWFALLDSFCKYNPGKLKEIAAADAAQAPLAIYLAFLTLEHSNSQSATMDTCMAASQANPRCLRLIDAMCSLTGPGMLNQLTETGPQTFSRMLGSEFPKLPGMTKALLDQFAQLKRPGGNPLGRETMCQALISEGKPETDKGEPSWAALGRLIQETTFAQTQRRANLICEKWGVDASDYVAEVRPLIAEHRFSSLIEAYGALHNNAAAAKVAIKKFPVTDLSVSQLPVYFVMKEYQLMDAQPLRALWFEMVSNRDNSAFEIETVMTYTSNQFKAGTMSAPLEALSYEGPDSPWLVVAKLAMEDWDDAKAAKWEADHGDFPTVAMALGRKYTEMKRWRDAERCYKKYIAASPDVTGYEALAATYANQSQEDKWLQTLKDYLDKTEDYGLEHAGVQVEIANHFMAKQQYAQAVEYADQAAGTGAGWALLCAADAHTGTGDFKTAEALIVEEIQHYSSCPYRWLAWCAQTGHGNRAAATAAVKEYFQQHGQDLSDEEMIQAACFYRLTKDNAKALAVIKERFKRYPGPLSLAHIMIDADELKDFDSQSQAMQEVDNLAEQDSDNAKFDVILKHAYEGGDSKIDLPAVENLIKDADPKTKMELCYFTGAYLNSHGQPDQAIEYFKKSRSGYTGYCVEQPLIVQALRDKGIDPATIDAPATQPAK